MDSGVKIDKRNQFNQKTNYYHTSSNTANCDKNFGEELNETTIVEFSEKG
jgi:hypothetical protein